MSLCIATCVPDGIILCSDTLQTMNGQRTHNFTLTCSKCTTQHPLTLNTQVPIGTFPTAQKQHHLKIHLQGGGFWSLGVLNAGNLNIGQNRVSKLIRDFEKTIMPTQKIDEIADNMRDFFIKEVVAASNIQNISQYSGDPVHLLLCGYDINETAMPPKKFAILIEKTPRIDPHPGLGAAWVGKTEIPSLFNNHAFMKTVGLDSISVFFHLMNIQDAIDYNRFLITTVMGYQKFAPMMADVGGEIEIGIIRAGIDYQWVYRHSWT